ncbi:hypothetical protein K470DRAFT_262432 [Piedraia hortae CBS 480.64]|uniref:Uncharacterized protein n=1 Tax=Piedraia hortae CBS 480.64 TaxID=1314780 RepID=A0A6A7C6S3_9PEZI|nr:hypothetical protein K470DRAFT_262432 [Piedraia hortae CBS 480.64]
MVKSRGSRPSFGSATRNMRLKTRADNSAAKEKEQDAQPTEAEKATKPLNGAKKAAASRKVHEQDDKSKKALAAKKTPVRKTETAKKEAAKVTKAKKAPAAKAKIQKATTAKNAAAKITAPEPEEEDVPVEEPVKKQPAKKGAKAPAKAKVKKPASKDKKSLVVQEVADGPEVPEESNVPEEPEVHVDPAKVQAPEPIAKPPLISALKKGQKGNKRKVAFSPILDFEPEPLRPAKRARLALPSQT